MPSAEARLLYDIRPMRPDDLSAAHQLSSEVGWPHRREDWELVLSLGQGLVACAGNRVVATGLFWSYGRMITRIGMVIVDPAIQRSGLGRVLMQAILDRTNDPTVILNATAQGETLYRQLGFIDFGTIIQHQGAARSVLPLPVRADERLRPAGREDLPHLIALDAGASGVMRASVIETLLDASKAVILEQAGEVAGFAFYRPFGRGHAIGPVIARDDKAAKMLIAHWLNLHPETFTRIDIVQAPQLSSWLEAVGLARVSQVTSMGRGPLLHPAGAFHTFGILNQALG